MTKELNRTIPPKILYKYVPVETAFIILQNKTIRFSNPKCFNDPYDSNIPILLENEQVLGRDYFEYIINKIEQIKSEYNDEHNPLWKNVDTSAMKNILQKESSITEPADIIISKYLTPIKNNMRVLSLSAKFDNLLMWGHYTNNHNGIVLGFSTNNLFFKHATRVQYTSEIPKISDLLLYDVLIEKRETYQEMHKILNSKSLDWKYEQEWRCTYDVEIFYNYLKYIKNIMNFNSEFLEALENKQDIIDNPITPQVISEIYIGAKMNILDENKVIQHVKQEYTHVKLFKMELSKDEFKLIPRMIRLING